MTAWPALRRRSQVTPCTVEIEHSETSLHAHLELDGGVTLRAGDRVRIHGPAIQVEFGQRQVLRRLATLERAGLLDRLWIRLAAPFALAELYEVSFTPGRLP